MDLNSDGEKLARRSTEGRLLLADALKSRELSHTSAARLLGVSQPTVSAWIDGSKRPEPEWRERIEREFGVLRDAWYTARERAIAEPVAPDAPRAA